LASPIDLSARDTVTIETFLQLSTKRAMAVQTWLLFLFTSIGISLTPGPNGLLALTHGAMHGHRKTTYTIAGGVFGFIGVIALCMFGIGALIQASVAWLTVLKWIGGAYLAWLGVKLWRSPPIAIEVSGHATEVNVGALFRQGLLTAATNPKGLLFFSALLPQFIDPHRDLAVQFAVIALTYGAVEFFVEFAVAGAASKIRPWLARTGRRFNKTCGGIFIAVGIALPLRSN
jgi:homoserine/homoserine lactone efflux protein